MATEGALSGSQWLERLTFDVLCHIVWFLDVQSISNLASTCESVQEAIRGSKTIWLRVLRILSVEQSIPPHCFWHLTSVEDLRAAATRWPRIRAALADHRLPLSPRVEKYSLDVSSLFHGTSLKFTPPSLLPGGRWLLGAAIHDSGSFVICWDVRRRGYASNSAALASCVLLQPAAHMELGEGLTVEGHGGSWMKIQGTPGGDGVIIAVRASNNKGMRVHRIMQLSWSNDDAPPTLTLRAELDDHARYLPDAEIHRYHLQGDYLAINTYDSILVWNWADDTVCTMSDPAKLKWAGDLGFWLSLQPPFLFAFPIGRRGSIVPIPIPPMVARRSYTGPCTPDTLPYIPFEISGHSWPVSMNPWQSYESQPGIDIIPSHGLGLHFLVYFNPRPSPIDGNAAPLRYVPQAHQTFKGSPISNINVIGPDRAALSCVPLQSHGGLQVKLDVFSQHTDGYFSPAHSRAWDLNELGWRAECIFAGPICPVSGTVLFDMSVVPRRAGLASAKTVAILSFD